MNYSKFKQVAQPYQHKMFKEWCRNRAWRPDDEMFTDWYSQEWVCRELKKTEREYERLWNRARVAKPTGVPAGVERDSGGVVNCPGCGLRLGLREVE